MSTLNPRCRAHIIQLIEEREEREQREQMTAAYREWTATYPQWAPPLCRPVRSNQPKAGDAGYEPHSPAPQMTLWQWLVAAGVCLAGAYAFWWLLSWAAGLIAGSR